MDLNKTGDYIRKKRLERGMTQAQLAEALNVSQRSVSRWENGSNLPELSLLQPLAMELNVTTEELLLGDKCDRTDEKQQVDQVLNYSILEKLDRLRKARRILTIVLVIMLLILIDLCVGYFSTSLHWTIEGREFQSYGLIFGLIFGREREANFDGNHLTQMFSIFIFFVVWLIIVAVALLMVGLIENRISRNESKS